MVLVVEEEWTEDGAEEVELEALHAGVDREITCIFACWSGEGGKDKSDSHLQEKLEILRVLQAAAAANHGLRQCFSALHINLKTLSTSSISIKSSEYPKIAASNLSCCVSSQCSFPCPAESVM